MRVQPVHFFLLVLVILLLFGANRLPDLARSVGKSMKIFKSEIKDLRDEPSDTPPAAPPPAPPTAAPPTAGPKQEAPTAPASPDPAPADPRPKDL